MKFLDNNGKIFGKINVMDFFIGVVILALILGAVVRFATVDRVTGANGLEKDIVYTVRVDRIRDFGNIQVGDALYDRGMEFSVGTIIAIDTFPAEDKLVTNDGEVITGLVENRVDMILTIEAPGIQNEKGSFVEKVYELLVGSNKSYYTKYREFGGRINSIIE